MAIIRILLRSHYKFTGSTLVNLLKREINEVRTVSCVDIYGLTLMTNSDTIVLISLNVLLEPSRI